MVRRSGLESWNRVYGMITPCSSPSSSALSSSKPCFRSVILMDRGQKASRLCVSIATALDRGGTGGKDRDVIQGAGTKGDPREVHKESHRRRAKKPTSEFCIFFYVCDRKRKRQKPPRSISATITNSIRNSLSQSPSLPDNPRLRIDLLVLLPISELRNPRRL